MEQSGLNPYAAKVKDLEINNEVYQVEAVQFGDETFFFVKQYYEVVCMIMPDEKNKWKPDCDVNEELFQQITKRINESYFY